MSKVISISDDAHESLKKIQAVVQLKEDRKVTMSEVIEESCRKWDSLIQSYEALKDSFPQDLEDE